MQIIGYGRRNITEVIIMKNLDSSGKNGSCLKNYGKRIHEKYYEWKNWCIRLNRLPDFFGTRDNPIPIDEFEL